MRADAIFDYYWRHLPASVTNGIHFFFYVFIFFCWPNQNFLLTLIQFTEQTKKVWKGNFWSFRPTLFLDNVFVAVVEHSKANMQRMWQNYRLFTARVWWMNLNILFIMVVKLCSLVCIIPWWWFKRIGDRSTHACTCAHTRVAPGVSLHGINIFMGGKKTPQSVHRDKGYLCVSAEETCM